MNKDGKQNKSNDVKSVIVETSNSTGQCIASESEKKKNSDSSNYGSSNYGQNHVQEYSHYNNNQYYSNMYAPENHHSYANYNGFY